MSISSEINRISQNISDSLTAIAAKGVTVPSGSNSDDLAALIAQISGGGGGTYTRTEICPLQTFTGDSSQRRATLTGFTEGLLDAGYYIVTYDGVEWLTTCETLWSSNYCIGEAQMFLGTPDSVYPFGVIWMSGTTATVAAMNTSQHTIKIEKLLFVGPGTQVKTGTITRNDTNTVPRVQVNGTGTSYRTNGQTFEYSVGDYLYFYLGSSENYNLYVYLDGVLIRGTAQTDYAYWSGSYFYFYPVTSVSLEMGRNENDSWVYINTVGNVLDITSNGRYDTSAYDATNVNVPTGSGGNLQTKSVNYTPTTSAQSAQVTADSGYDGLQQVNVSVGAMPTGTAGTPTATKGTVSNHSVSVTPSVTNSAGYIPSGTKTGTPVTVSASELVSGSETKTANGTYDVTNLAELVVNVSSGGSSKNTQVVQGTTRTTSSTMTAIGAEMTVSKTGTYDVYWSAFRSSTSSSYTYATQLYIDNVAYGSEDSTWSNHVQNNHLSNVPLTSGQKIRVRGRNSRGSSYYIYAPTLVIVES